MWPNEIPPRLWLKPVLSEKNGMFQDVLARVQKFMQPDVVRKAKLTLPHCTDILPSRNWSFLGPSLGLGHHFVAERAIISESLFV